MLKNDSKLFNYIFLFDKNWFFVSFFLKKIKLLNDVDSLVCHRTSTIKIFTYLCNTATMCLLLVCLSGNEKLEKKYIDCF